MTLIQTVVDSEKYRVQHQLHYSSQVGHDSTPVWPHSAGYQRKQIWLSRIVPDINHTRSNMVTYTIEAIQDLVGTKPVGPIDPIHERPTFSSLWHL